jgi:hypothetical protein
MSVLFAFILCVGRGLATGWSSVQGVLQTVFRIKKLKKLPRPKIIIILPQDLMNASVLSQNVRHLLAREHFITFVHGTHNTTSRKYGNMWKAALCLRYENVKCFAPEPPGNISSCEQGCGRTLRQSRKLRLPQGEMITQMKNCTTLVLQRYCSFVLITLKEKSQFSSDIDFDKKKMFVRFSIAIPQIHKGTL